MASSAEKTVSLQTVGCRLNQYETERIAAELAACGFRRVRMGESADLYIINTCTVTHRADADNRRLISRAARQGTGARIVVVGCSVEHDARVYGEMAGVSLVVGNRDKDRILEILRERFPELFDVPCPLGQTVPAARFQRHNRAWLKVSDGCNQRCAFCIVPSVRGGLTNREPLELITEINELVAAGFREVVLTGVNLGYYRSASVEPGVRDLADLCALILNRTTVGRIRLSSIEPQTISEALLGVLVSAGDRACHHLHVPLQSGSSRILRLMRRPYDAEAYAQRVRAARAAIPDLVVGGDVIVGFPGESAQDFDDTRAFVTSGLLDYLHVFSYSDRPGTPAAEMSGKVPPEAIKSRHLALVEISDGLRAQSNRRQVGRVLEVIAENRKPEKGQFWGVAGNYTRVKLPMAYGGGRGMVRYEVISAHGSYVDGRILP